MTNQDIWAERVAEWRASGVTPHQFCQDQPYSPSSLYYWIRKLDTPLVAEHEFARVVRRSRATMEAAPADDAIASEHVDAKTAPPAPFAPPLLVEVDGVRIWVEDAGQGAALAAVLAVLGARRHEEAR
jgi:hypothetical protein